MFRRTTAVAAAIVLLGAIATFAPTAGATKPCPVKYCTSASGEYVLTVPPLTSNPLLAVYADCIWNAHVDFGDGTEQDYVFDASVGLTGSHTFPTPGTLYTVQVELRDGHPAQGGGSCPDYDQSADVLFRTASEEADDPPKEEPPPPVPTDGGGSTPGPVPTPAGSQTGNAGTPGPGPRSDSVAYWRRCREAVLTHLIACGKGRKVARAALAKLTQPGSARVSGFSCRLPRGAVQPIACARGEQRVLVPVA